MVHRRISFTFDASRHLPAATALAILLLIPSASWAQDKKKSALPTGENPPNLVTLQPVNGTVATVMGRVITRTEVDRELKTLTKALPDLQPMTLYWLARRNVAIRLLIVEKAKQYCGSVTDREVIEHFTRSLDLDEQKVKEELELFRDEYARLLYMHGRMGFSTRLDGVSPDYASHMVVAPHEIRTEYQRLVDEIESTPTTIRLAQFVFPATAFRGRASMDLATGELRESLAEKPPEEKLAELAKKWPGCIFLPTDIKEKEDRSARPEILEFASRAGNGEVSEPVDLGNGMAVLYVLDRNKKKPPTWEEAQETIRNKILKAKEEYVTEAILRELMEKADYSPMNLFFPSEDERQASHRAARER